MKTGLRRSHVKSRHGCGQCKIRRKKCDERPPVCSNCKRRNLKCDYEALFNTESRGFFLLEPPESKAAGWNFVPEFGQSVSRWVISDNRPNPNPTTSLSTIIGQGNAEKESHHDSNAWLASLSQFPSNPAYLNQPGQDNELMFHFLTIAANTLSHERAAFHSWQQIAYSVAQRHDFVRHTLLAFSSLHIAHLQPQNSQKYVWLTSNYHGMAIMEFKEQVQSVDSSNSDAIFIFSALLVLTEMGLMRPVWDGRSLEIDPIEKLMQQFMVVRNVLTLWRHSRSIRTEPIIRELIGHGRYPHAPAIVDEVIATLSYLEVLNQETAEDLEEQAMYSKTIRELGATYYFVKLRANAWFPVLRWAKGISSDFVMRLRSKCPLALLILAQYCVIVHEVSRYHWWTRGWSEQIFQKLVTCLDSQYMPYLRSSIIAMSEHVNQ